MPFSICGRRGEDAVRWRANCVEFARSVVGDEIREVEDRRLDAKKASRR